MKSLEAFPKTNVCITLRAEVVCPCALLFTGIRRDLVTAHCTIFMGWAFVGKMLSNKTNVV